MTKTTTPYLAIPPQAGYAGMLDIFLGRKATNQPHKMTASYVTVRE